MADAAWDTQQTRDTLVGQTEKAYNYLNTRVYKEGRERERENTLAGKRNCWVVLFFNLKGKGKERQTGRNCPATSSLPKACNSQDRMKPEV